MSWNEFKDSGLHNPYSLWLADKALGYLFMNDIISEQELKEYKTFTLDKVLLLCEDSGFIPELTFLEIPKPRVATHECC